VKLARRYHIPVVRWHRERLPNRKQSPWPATTFKQWRIARVLNLFGRLNARMAPHLRGTHGTWGVEHTGGIDAAFLIRAAQELPPGVTEIMTHPGLGDDLDASATRLRESRVAELQALCDPAVREAFAGNKVELIHYGNLHGSTG
jgi:predicted glycoside hydrolase/deacetylase ChbG (UPF0249 family)